VPSGWNAAAAVLIAVLLIVPGLIELTGHDAGRLTPQNHPPAVPGPIKGCPPSAMAPVAPLAG